ncbi:MAG: hypothetical protein IJU36_09355 [Paludibacteraceae bacterium]|nr:hypothetical protein [Paludibacteraceae bacterium]
MRKIIVITLLLTLTRMLAAQVYLTEVLEPIGDEKSLRHVYPFIEDSERSVYNSMTLQDYLLPAGIALYDKNEAISFKLNKQYSKLSFMFGPTGNNRINDAGVMIITGDGETIFDEYVLGFSEPRFMVVDVAGIDQITFSLVEDNQSVNAAMMQLWKEGENVVMPELPFAPPARKTQLVAEHLPYCTKFHHMIREDLREVPYLKHKIIIWSDYEDSISIGRYIYKSGIQMRSSQGLFDANEGYCFFWLNKQYEKISFIVGPRDNISSHASTWLVITGDKGKILYEEIVSQTDIPRQVVVDVSGQDRICFKTELRGCDFLGGITFGVVDMWAYTKKDLAQVPQEGLVNPNKEKLAALPSPCPLISKIPSFSYHGKAKPEAVIFDGQSRHITFSMGGEKFNQGLIFTTGSNLLNDNIDCYFMFDLGGEFDYLSFYAGMLTNRHALANDSLRIYADGKLILDTIIRCAWPNQYFEVPINKCRKLTFAKPGNSTLNKDCYICLGDLAVYRGKPVKHHLFKHDRPECPEQADLIDLCGKPYFHYVGRYLSNITDFDFEDCFMDGSTKRRSFHMKDGTEIYKGVMLEANMPPFFEDATLMDVAMIGLLGAGSSISGSDVAAYTGVTAGASPVALLALPLMNHSGGQASAASFNTYGEYKSCTFTIANKSEYWDAMDQIVNLGERQDKPFRLNVMADHRIVKQIDLTNRMEPQTFTVPLYNSNSLTFWLEPGDTRSGQFVIYDITVSKAPCDIITPTDSIVTSPEGRPGEVVETGGNVPPPVWAE